MDGAPRGIRRLSQQSEALGRWIFISVLTVLRENARFEIAPSHLRVDDWVPRRQIGDGSARFGPVDSN